MKGLLMELEQLLKNWINENGFSVVNIIKRVNQESRSSQIYYATTTSNLNLVLKLCHSKQRWSRELFFLNFLKDKIIVPRVYAIGSIPEHEIYMVLMQQLEGSVISPKKLDSGSNDIACKMGAVLANLHHIPVDYYGDLIDPEYGKKDREATDEYQDYFERSLSECEPIFDKRLFQACSQLYKNYAFDCSLLDGPRLVHRDFRPGNIIVNKGEISGIIDFENTRANFSQEDFAIMQMIVWENYPKTKDAFLEGYQSVRKLPILEPVLNMLVVGKLLGACGFFIRRGTWNNEHAGIFEKNITILRQKVTALQ